MSKTQRRNEMIFSCLDNLKVSGKRYFKILKVTKNQDFTLFLEDTSFEKPQGGGGVKFD